MAVLATGTCNWPRTSNSMKGPASRWRSPPAFLVKVGEGVDEGEARASASRLPIRLRDSNRIMTHGVKFCTHKKEKRMRRRVRSRPMSLRHVATRELIARFLLLGWTGTRIARKLHCSLRQVRYAVARDPL